MVISLSVPAHNNATEIAAKISNAAQLQESDEYKEKFDDYIELTMSCDPSEVLNFCKGVMTHSVEQGLRNKRVKNDSLRIEFLAAYDLYNHVILA